MSLWTVSTEIRPTQPAQSSIYVLVYTDVFRVFQCSFHGDSLKQVRGSRIKEKYMIRVDAGPKRRTLNAETGSSNQQRGSSEVHSNKKQSTLYYATTSINFLHVFIVRLSRSVGVSGNFPAWVGVVTGFTSGAELSVPYLYVIHDQSAEGFFRPALSSTYCQFGLLPMAATRPPWSLALCL